MSGSKEYIFTPLSASILIPIIVIFISIISVILSFYILYPFILRYLIDYNESILPQSSITNGANGANGVHGSNSPEGRNGTHGKPGKNTSSGVHGIDGKKGVPGISGIQGNDGVPGIQGNDGNDGVPGFNVVKVREDLFDTTSDKVYYVNGLSLIEHTSSLADKSTKIFNTEIERLSIRITNSFKSVTNKIYFNKVLNNVVEIPVTISPDPIVLDTVQKFNTFLDGVLNTYIIARNTIESVKNTDLVIIDSSSNDLQVLKVTRDNDLLDVDGFVYITALRLDKIVPHRDTYPVASIYYTTLDDLLDSTILFDSKIRIITLLLNTQQRIFNLNTTLPIDKNNSSIEIKILTDYINMLKSLKNEIKTDINNMKNIILDTYASGGSVGTVYGVNFSTYGPPGANSLKTTISIYNLNIISAIDLCKSTMDSFIDPYKLLNIV